jgi:hypothetical protein
MEVEIIPSVEHYVGIGVSLELSSVCVVDGRGKIVNEAKVASEPEAQSHPPTPRKVGFGNGERCRPQQKKQTHS